MPEQRIAIVGAGIGGLTLAIALQQRGVEVTLYDQSAHLEEVGAGVALWSNSTRLLERLGLGEAIHAQSAEPTEVIFRRSDGEKIVGFPLTADGVYRKTFGAPYYGIHRRALQKILIDAVAPGTIQLNHRLERLEAVSSEVTRLHWADGTQSEADLVIGADGIRSKVRSWMHGGLDYTMYSKTSGFRGIVPIEQLPSLPDPTATQFWVGDGRHLLHFPTSKDYKTVTFLAAEEHPKIWPSPGASRTDCTQEEALSGFADWHPAAAEMIGAIEHTERWALFGVGPMDTWSKGNVTLIGDAAHGLVPHHGQGANQCVEDAVILTDVLLADGSDSTAERLQRYSDLRMERATKVQKISWVSNRLFHLPEGPEIPLRDATFRNLAENVSWIHEYDAGAEVPSALSRS